MYTMMCIVMFRVLNYEEKEQEVEIELVEEEPPFLKGQTSALELSPIRVVRNPDGSMQRAALAQQGHAKDRKEEKEQESRAFLESIPRDLTKGWADPLPESGDRMLAADVRNASQSLKKASVPEWREHAFGKNVRIITTVCFISRHVLARSPAEVLESSVRVYLYTN